MRHHHIPNLFFYETLQSRQVRISHFFNFLFLFSGQCVSPLKTCKGDLCQCDMDFAMELQKVQHHWSEEFVVQNGFDREARCQKRSLNRTTQKYLNLLNFLYSFALGKTDLAHLRTIFTVAIEAWTRRSLILKYGTVALMEMSPMLEHVQRAASSKSLAFLGPFSCRNIILYQLYSFIILLLIKIDFMHYLFQN